MIIKLVTMDAWINRNLTSIKGGTWEYILKYFCDEVPQAQDLGLGESAGTAHQFCPLRPDIYEALLYIKQVWPYGGVPCLTHSPRRALKPRPKDYTSSQPRMNYRVEDPNDNQVRSTETKLSTFN